MANVQITRQHNASQLTKTATKLDQKQSLEVVQTMLHSAISSVTYLRELFPTKAYTSRWYEYRDTVLPYEDYIAGNLPRFAEEAQEPRINVPILQHRRSKRVDVFLQWLEITAFEELKTGDLRAIKIYVHINKDRRQDVLETYTFTIQYTASEHGIRTPSGLDVSGMKHTGVTIEASNIALQQALRQIAEMCNDMPQLPPKRLVSMELFYDPEVVRPGKLAGFIPGDGKSLYFAQANGWEKHTQCQRHDSGFHSTIMRISSLQTSGDHDDDGGETGKPRSFPTKLTFLHGASRDSDIEVTDSVKEIPMASQSTSMGRRNLAADVNAAEDQSNKPTAENDFLSAVSAGLRTSSAPANDQGTYPESQPSLIPQMQHALRGMMLPEEISQGDTQALGHASASLGAGNTSETRRASSRSGGASPQPEDTYRLTTNRVRDIKSKQRSLRDTARRLAVEIGSRTKSGNIILCQCGHAKEEGDMVQCTICDTWQHLHCFGFTGSEDSRLSNEHICYWCLLGDNNQMNYQALQQLALERRGMYRVYHKGLRTKTDLANDLVLDQPTARDLHTEIKKSGFVKQTAKSHKAGFRATGQALYVPVIEGPEYRSMFERYFDPMTNVGEHYHKPPAAAMSTEAAAFQQRLSAKLPASMAPPATPRAGGSRKSMSATSRSESQSPASGLDLPVSRPMFETPTLTARRQTRVSKRPLEVQENEDSPAKRTATPRSANRHFVSYISKQMIDAGGESSPFSVRGSPRKSRRQEREL